MKTVASGPALQGPFSDVMAAQGVTDPFILNWLNMLSFLLQGLPADGTLTAVMAYMVGACPMFVPARNACVMHE